MELWNEELKHLLHYNTFYRYKNFIYQNDK